MQLGNGAWESTTFNSRLQPEQIALGTVKDGMDLLDLDYTYGTTANNGNVLTQRINFSGLAHPFQQTYTYDSLNRLSTAAETYNSGQTWKQAFTYDRYGNRNFDELNTTFTGFDKLCSGNTVLCADLKKLLNPSIAPSNNRLVENQDGDSTDDYKFDPAGNTTRDPNLRKFTYDGENKQVKVETVDSGGDVTGLVGQYWYDGDGRRVKKYVPPAGGDPGEVTVFVYDAAGKLVAEYSTAVADANDAKVAYLTSDHLGSPRINTDKNGNVTARHDYHPFGGEIATSQRTAGLGYVEDEIRKQFTGYERDAETGLDFAKARTYASSHGRFNEVDPFNIILEVKAEVDPKKAKSAMTAYLLKVQQWNRYSYVTNNPLLYIDPTGEVLELTGSKEEQDDAYNRLMDLCGKKCEGRLFRRTTKDGRTLVGYLGNRGGLSGRAGHIGLVLEKLIDSSTLVQLQITSKNEVTDVDGDKWSVAQGGLTLPVSSKHIQIWINSSVSMTTISDTQFFLGIKADDGSKLVNTNSTLLAHELGHAWGAIEDRFYERYNNTYKIQLWQRSNLRDENNKSSLRVENWQRSRLGLKQRATH